MMPVQEQQLALSTALCFGKVPTHGDFVRHNANGPSARALDEWLQEALYVAKPHLGRGDTAAGARAPQYGFVFSPPRSQRPLAGVMQMSRDQVGRAYPFVAAVEWDARHAEPGRLGTAAQRIEPVLMWASALVEQATAGGLDHRNLGQHIAETASRLPPSPPSIDGALPRGATLKQLCESLWGSFDDGRKYRAFKNVLDIHGSLNGSVPLGYSLCLRFPITSRSEWSLPLSFWLSLCSRMVRRTSSTPSFFFTERSGSAGSPFLMLYLGTASPRSAAALFAPAFGSNDIVDVERAGRGSDADAALALPPTLGLLLEEGNADLWEVLESL